VPSSGSVCVDAVGHVLTGGDSIVAATEFGQTLYAAATILVEVIGANELGTPPTGVIDVSGVTDFARTRDTHGGH
jgi:hypothetical protein